MRSAIMLGIWLAALWNASASAGESALARLNSDRADERAAAMNEIAAAGEKSIPDIEAAYAKLPEDQRDLRERYRDVAARIRTGQVKAWALKTASTLDKGLDWDLLQRNLVWLPKPATPADARRALCQVSCATKNWAEPEAVKLLALCLQDAESFVREAAVWTLDRDGWNGPALEALASVLKDESEKVRSAAGSVLASHNDPRGVSAVLAGALSNDPPVRDLCAQTLPALILADDAQPQRPRFKHTAEDVAALVRLIGLDDIDGRGTAIRLLGLIGDRSAGPALFTALGKEPIPKNRRRLAVALAQLRHRPAAAALVKLLPEAKDKLRSGEEGKNDFAWGVAAAWAQIGDPDSVPAMIELLGNGKCARYVAAGLSWAFGMAGAEQDYTRGDGPSEVLVPILISEGRLDRQWVAKAPKAEEFQKLWEGFWAANKNKYKWSDEASTLRRNVRPRPIVWPAPPLPGTRINGTPAGKKGEWVQIPITVQNTICSITGIAVDRTNGDVYAIPMLGPLHQPGCSRGVWKSRDHGATFEKTAENDTGGGAGCWASMNMDPTGARLAVFSMYGAVAITLDSGVTWRRLTSISMATTDWGDIDWDDPAARTVMQTNHERSPGQHVSSDGGRTWQPIVPEVSYKTGLGVFDAKTLLNIEHGEIRRSDDLGKTWASVAKPTLKTIVLRKFKGVGYLISDKGLLVSADKGKTWAVQGSPLPDPTVFAGPYFGRDERHILAVGRQGILESTDAGATWKIATPLPDSFRDKAIAKAAANNNYMDGAIFGYDAKSDILYISLSHLGASLFYRYER